MLWALNLSILTILRSFMLLINTDLPLCVLILMEYLMVTNTIALTLVYIVANFLEYFSRLILKRIPNYDHDFLATGCQAAIVGLSFYLGALQTFSLFSVNKIEEQPLHIPPTLGFILSTTTLIYVLHKLFSWCKTCKIKQNRISVVTFQAWTSTLRPDNSVNSIPSNPVILQLENLPLNAQLNNERFNPDVTTDHSYNLMNAIGSSVFLMFFLAYINAEHITGFHGYIYNLWSCFVLPFIFCTVSPKLRGFIIKSLVKCSSHLRICLPRL